MRIEFWRHQHIDGLHDKDKLTVLPVTKLLETYDIQPNVAEGQATAIPIHNWCQSRRAELEAADDRDRRVSFWVLP